MEPKRLVLDASHESEVVLIKIRDRITNRQKNVIIGFKKTKMSNYQRMILRLLYRTHRSNALHSIQEDISPCILQLKFFPFVSDTNRSVD